jgi:hypothetical protein
MSRLRMAAMATGVVLLLGACSGGASNAGKSSTLKLTGGGAEPAKHNSNNPYNSSFKLGSFGSTKITLPRTGTGGSKGAGRVGSGHGTGGGLPTRTGGGAEGSFTVANSLNFGVDAAIRTLALHNGTPGSVSFTAIPSASWLILTPAQAVIAPGQGMNITVTLDRAHAPIGQLSGTITVNGGPAGAQTVSVNATVARGPSIINLAQQSSSVLAGPCPAALSQTQVFANVSEINGVASVVVVWSAPGQSSPQSGPMSIGPDGRYSAVLGPFSPGTVIWAVSATAVDGSAAASSGVHLNVSPCPPPSVTGEQSLNQAVSPKPCTTNPTTTTAVANAADPSGISSVTLNVVAPGATTPQTIRMTAAGGSWTATLGPFTTLGTVRWWVVAVAGDGLTASGPSRALAVNTCP